MGDALHGQFPSDACWRARGRAFERTSGLLVFTLGDSASDVDDVSSSRTRRRTDIRTREDRDSAGAANCAVSGSTNR